MKKRIFLFFIISFILFNPIKVFATQYKVDFFDGTKNEVILVEENATVNKPNNPEKEGYKFLYWINRKTLQEFNFNTKITEDIKLIAEWKQIDIDMQKDVAKMIKNKNKDNDVFGITNKEKETIKDRLFDLKILIPSIILLIISLILVIIFTIKKIKNKVINNRKKENNKIICRFCGKELNKEDKKCPYCETIVIRK